MLGAVGGVLRFYRALYAEGGVLVLTTEAAPDADGRPVVLARSLIQPDGDVVTTWATSAVGQPAVVERHGVAVVRALAPLRSVERGVRVLRFGALVPAAWTAYHLASTGCDAVGCGVELPGGSPAPIVAGLALSGVMALARLGVGLLVRWQVGRLT